jgi:hypothetical protein
MSAMILESAFPPVPTTQRAIVQDADGNPTSVQDAGVPFLLPNTILIKTAVVALNPSDYKMRPRFPSKGAVIGMDFAGKIVEMDPEATKNRTDLKIVIGFVVLSMALIQQGATTAPSLSMCEPQQESSSKSRKRWHWRKQLL